MLCQVFDGTRRVPDGYPTGTRREPDGYIGIAMAHGQSAQASCVHRGRVRACGVVVVQAGQRMRACLRAGRTVRACMFHAFLHANHARVCVRVTQRARVRACITR